MWVREAAAVVSEGKAGSARLLDEGTKEVEMLDSVSSKQVDAYIEERVRRKYNWTHGANTAV